VCDELNGKSVMFDLQANLVMLAKEKGRTIYSKYSLLNLQTNLVSFFHSTCSIAR